MSASYDPKPVTVKVWPYGPRLRYEPFTPPPKVREGIELRIRCAACKRWGLSGIPAIEEALSGFGKGTIGTADVNDRRVFGLEIPEWPDAIAVA